MKEAVVAIIRNANGQILSVSRKDNPQDFGLPGGKVDPGEDRLHALGREVWEETGLTLRRSKEVFTRSDSEFKVTAYEVTCEDLNTHTEENGVLAWKTEAELSANGTFSDYNKALFEKISGKR